LGIDAGKMIVQAAAHEQTQVLFKFYFITNANQELFGLYIERYYK